MSTTAKSNSRKSHGVSTATTPASLSPSTLSRMVMCQAIRDIVNGSESARNEVVHWLVSDDFKEICHHAQVDPDEYRIQIANLYRCSPALMVYYAKKLTQELRTGASSSSQSMSTQSPVSRARSS